MTAVERTFLYGGALLYALGSVMAISAVRSGDRRGLAHGRIHACLAIALHAGFLALLGTRTSHFPVTSAFEACVFLATAVMVVGLALDGLRRLPILTVATLPLALVTTILAIALSFAAPAGQAPGRGVSSIWASLHTFVGLGSYAAFALAFVGGVLYLVTQRQLKEHSESSFLGLMPSLETVSRINVRSMAAGVALLTAGLLVGYLHARNVYPNQSAWRLDPKIILTTLTVAVYAAVLALSARPAFRGRRTALASIFGFFLVVATFWASVFWSGFHRFR